MKSLLHKSLMQFVICTAMVLLLATPLFYLLTKYSYAEDLMEIINATQQNKPLPATDLEEDIIQGVMLQFILITGVLSISFVLMMRFISKRLWIPFDDTLKQIEGFTLENQTLPQFTESDVREFTQLNTVLTRLMKNNMESYRTQKEFTENASHEMQTPLAVFQSKLDILLQEPDMTETQAKIVQSLYEISNRLSRLNKNLLLLARIDNRQYKQTEQIDVTGTLKEVISLLDKLTEGITVHQILGDSPLSVQGNQTLLESMINNLVVNAVRHNIKKGDIYICITDRQLIISNTSSEKQLDSDLLFYRFYRSSEKVKGNGLGLAIVKAICNYHGWQIRYIYKDNMHNFIVQFP